jgi:hypothetical protein
MPSDAELTTLWLDSIGLGEYAEKFEAAGYQELAYIADLSADDAQIVAEEELELSPIAIQTFIGAYAAATKFEPGPADVSETTGDCKEGGPSLRELITARDELALQSALIASMKSPNAVEPALLNEVKLVLEDLAQARDVEARLHDAIRAQVWDHSVEEALEEATRLGMANTQLLEQVSALSLRRTANEGAETYQAGDDGVGKACENAKRRC